MTSQRAIKLRETMTSKFMKLNPGSTEEEAYEAYRQHMASIGSKGGRNGNTGGFAADRELASIAGKKGGSVSKRGKRVKTI